MDLSDKDKEKITALAKNWTEISQVKFRDSNEDRLRAEKTGDSELLYGSRLILTGAKCYSNCARELYNLINTGNLPSSHNIKVVKQNVK